jgi:hypothetical protein
MAPRGFNLTADQSHRPSSRLQPGSVDRGADQFDGQRQAPADHRQRNCHHDLSQQPVLDDLVMDQVTEGMPGQDALGHLDHGEQHQLAGSQPRRQPGGQIPPPRVATRLGQPTGQDPEDAPHRKDGADENRRRPPHVPGIGKNSRPAGRVGNGQQIGQDVTAQHSSRYQERQNSQPKQPPARHSPHISPKTSTSAPYRTAAGRIQAIGGRTHTWPRHRQAPGPR